MKKSTKISILQDYQLASFANVAKWSISQAARFMSRMGGVDMLVGAIKAIESVIVRNVLAILPLDTRS